MDIVVLPIEEKYLHEVLEVYQQCEDFLKLGPEPHASREMVQIDLEHSRQTGGQYSRITNGDGNLVGIVDWIPAGYRDDSEQAFISLLMIASSYRNRGIGEAVIKQVEARIQDSPGVKVIFSAVQVNNPRALRFWQRMGYRLDSGPELQGDGTITLLIRKDLSDY